MPDPTTAGFAFAGWYTSEIFLATTKISFIEPGRIGNLDLYANWVEINATAPRYVLSNVASVARGGEFTATVQLANNPGIITLRNALVFDNNAFRLLEVTRNESAYAGPFTPSLTRTSPFNLLWENAIEFNNSVSGQNFYTFKFSVRRDAPAGDYVISLNHIGGLNQDLQRVSFLDGIATVAVSGDVIEGDEILLGDLNGDGKIDDIDLLLLRRFLAGWPVDINHDAAKINGDNRISEVDLVLLRRYLAGWDVPQFLQN